MAAKYELDGYVFTDKEDFERAKKEKETIAYISAKTDMTDMKAIYKIYRIAVEKKSFQTVFGLEYMKDLRDRLSGSGIVTEEMLEPIPIGKVTIKRVTEAVGTPEEKQAAREIAKTNEEIEKLRFRSTIKNFLIAVLVVVVGVMLFTTYNYKYSIFTYFTDYEQKIRDEIADEYQEWEEELETREKAVEEKEKQ
ncbi:MAG: hypothetical protein IJ733_16605 [Lachnospiraceae bacterium]|nr:hypothetical protein [Lachnospiraceae bacterium]